MARSTEIVAHPLRRFPVLWLSFFTIAFGVNFLVHPLRPGSNEASQVADALLSGEGFANAFSVGPSGPTAHVAPIYPFLLASLGRIFRTRIDGGAAVIALVTLAWSLHCALVERFATMLGWRREGTIVAFALAAVPVPEYILRWEAALTAAAIAGGAYVVSRIALGSPGIWWGAVLGAISGVGTLVNPVTIVIWGAWFGLLVFKLGIRSAARALTPAAIVLLILVGAWTARNYAVFHHFVFVRDNAGLELAASYNDCALTVMSPAFRSTCYTPFHPDRDPQVEHELAAMGEYQFNAMCLATARTWIRAHPLRALAITAGHGLLFWFPIEHTEWQAMGAAISLLTAVSFLGLRWRTELGFQICAVAVTPFWIAYWFFRAVPRYRYPVLWMTALFCVLGVEAWWTSRRRERK